LYVIIIYFGIFIFLCLLSMKKFAVIIWTFLSLLLVPFSFVSAQLGDNILDGILWWFDYNFGYSNEVVTVKDITSTSIVLESPVVPDQNWEDIMDYALMYWEYSLDTIVGSSDFTLFDYLQEKTFSWLSPTNGKVTFDLNASQDDIDPNKVYYVVVAPINDEGQLWEVSATEICFILSDQFAGEWDDCEDQWWSHNSSNNNWSVNMSLANISHMIQGNSIKLTWTALDDVDEVEIYLRNTNGTSYTKLTTVAMSTEQYTFNPNRNAPLRVRFIGLDSDGNQVGNEVIYTINDYIVSWSSPTPTPQPSIPSVPTVGPADNALWAALVAIFVFLSITLRRRTQKG